ncbi:hypothetical protein KFL_001680050 [Klebsormidium nitens]|uniref:HAUS augmin-like complex subunit 1 n=1 Tax=Klebsormidium nitens TaxID=105231 RepID=A0A1Y1HZ12_KLENI|nr:hypothetical protein KFL_001680050 [Klebsormidium nitens]|eukprot:GAQ83910.1 hypothetical protein KFL_001680050 [Klebsormidium nitens]
MASAQSRLEASPRYSAPAQSSTLDGQQFWEVKQWLEETFSAAGRETPQFEVTARTVAELHRLSQLSKRRTRAVEIVVADLQDMSLDFRNESSREVELLDMAGIAPESFSQAGMTSLRALAGTANHLDLRDAETSSYLLAMADLALETARLDERQRATRREAEELRERTRKGIARLAQLKRALAELERGEESHRAPMKTWNEYMQVMISKDRQYTQQLVNYKAVLTRAGYTPEINHGTLLQAAQKNQELVKQTQPLLETLRSYQDLPPDKALAELAVEEKKRQLEATERRLEDAIHGMAVR